MDQGRENNEGQPAPQNNAPNNALEQTMAMVTTMTASMALSNAILGLPEFTGRNRPLKDFIQDVRNGLTCIPEGQRGNYLRAVISKLRGPARDSTYGKDFDSIDALIRHLKTRFAPGKNSAYYYGKIQDLRMKQGDTVGDFYDHLNILLNGAESALREEKGENYRDDMMVPTKEMAVDIFIRGLPADLSKSVDLSKPRTLEDAYTEAVRLEARMDAKILPDTRPRNLWRREDNNEDYSDSRNFQRRDRNYGDTRRDFRDYDPRNTRYGQDGYRNDFQRRNDGQWERPFVGYTQPNYNMRGYNGPQNQNNYYGPPRQSQYGDQRRGQNLNTQWRNNNWRTDNYSNFHTNDGMRNQSRGTYRPYNGSRLFNPSNGNFEGYVPRREDRRNDQNFHRATYQNYDRQNFRNYESQRPIETGQENHQTMREPLNLNRARPESHVASQPQYRQPPYQQHQQYAQQNMTRPSMDNPPSNPQVTQVMSIQAPSTQIPGLLHVADLEKKRMMTRSQPQ